MLKLIIVMSVSLTMMSCSSFKTSFPPSTVALPTPTIDNALVQPCSELPMPTNKRKSAHLLWKKQIILMYGECRDKHNALVTIVKDIK